MKKKTKKSAMEKTLFTIAWNVCQVYKKLTEIEKLLSEGMTENERRERMGLPKLEENYYTKEGANT